MPFTLKKALITFLLLHLYLSIYGQSKNLFGIVFDEKKTSLFAVTVRLSSDRKIGTTTNFDGKFKLSLPSLEDSLVISFIGYETQRIYLGSIDLSKEIEIQLLPNIQMLKAIEITAPSIAKDYSVTSINKMEIYLNPLSAGDPLKSLTLLPSSTNNDESVNPSLRGSSADRSRVVLNGSPIYKPVRNTQINGVGNFSLFNTELINSVNVYPTNPPLTYGNSSAGIVEIETINELDANLLHVSSGLAGSGVQISHKLDSHSFIQLYGNAEYSEPFVKLNKELQSLIQNFGKKDVGLNYKKLIAGNLQLKSFSYFINETYNVNTGIQNYSGTLSSGNRRFFTVNALELRNDRSILSLNTSFDQNNQSFRFGNIYSREKDIRSYISVNYKFYGTKNLTFQTGFSTDYSNNNFNDSVPHYFSALSEESPSFFIDTSLYNLSLEPYFFLDKNFNKKLKFSFGIRSNIPVRNQPYFLSYQLSLRKILFKKHIFILSNGQYHNYFIPNFYLKNNALQKSNQIALDYIYESKNTVLSAAAFYKTETGTSFDSEFNLINKTNILGAEISINQTIGKNFKLTLSNVFIDQIVDINGQNYTGSASLDYSVKTSLTYFNTKTFNSSIVFIARPGGFYTPLSGVYLDSAMQFYFPVLDQNINAARFSNYSSLSFNISKYTKLKKTAIIPYFSLSNILNSKNESSVIYSEDFSETKFNYFQGRMFFLGMVWELNY